MQTKNKKDRQLQGKLNADLPVTPLKMTDDKGKASKLNKNTTKRLDSVDEGNRKIELPVETDEMPADTTE